MTGQKVNIISSATTKHLLKQNSRCPDESLPRRTSRSKLKTRKRSQKNHPRRRKSLLRRADSASSAYQTEMKDFTLDLPTITFDKSYLLNTRPSICIWNSTATPTPPAISSFFPAAARHGHRRRQPLLAP